MEKLLGGRVSRINGDFSSEYSSTIVRRKPICPMLRLHLLGKTIYATILVSICQQFFTTSRFIILFISPGENKVFEDVERFSSSENFRTFELRINVESRKRNSKRKYAICGEKKEKSEGTFYSRKERSRIKIIESWKGEIINGYVR